MKERRDALVTGATGLVGSHIVEKLLSDGWRVRALVRTPDKARWLSAMGAEVVTGDVLDRTSLNRAASRMTHIFHTAAAILPRGGYEAYRSLNIDGTANVLTAAMRNAPDVPRVLHLSSVAVYGPTARYSDEPTHEGAAYEPLDESLYYARTKRESEQMMVRASQQGDVWTTAIRPCVIYGRRDRQFVPRVARALRFGILPIPGGGRTTLSVVHAANVADAAVLAVTTDAALGQAYNITTDASPVTGREFFRLAASGLRRGLRVLNVPIGPARIVTSLASTVAGITQGPGARAMARSSLFFLTRDNPFSSERAREELGWIPRVDPRTAIPDAFRWYAESRK